MPRGFTDLEKEKIRRRLLEEGRKQFGSFGIKKTSVEDLAKNGGISKGAFYQFFDSKEDLYFAVMEDFEGEQRKEMLEILEREEGNDRSKLKLVLVNILDKVETDPFLQRLLSKEEYQYLWQRLSEDQLKTALDSDVDFATGLMEIWRQRGTLKIADPRVVTGILRSVFFLCLHKSDIGEEVFPQVRDLLLDSVIEKIIEG